MEEFRPKGFTLVELMLIVAILGILVATAVPQFGNLLRKSKEAHTKGALGTIRSAVNIYVSDSLSNYSQNLTALTTDYMDKVPHSKLGTYHGDYDTELTISVSSITSSDITDANGWIYSSQSGSVAVNCSHTDRLGTVYYEW